MKFTKNKKPLTLLAKLLPLALFVFIAFPTIVFAGDQSLTAPTKALCQLGGNVQTINLNIPSEGTACVQQGGKIVRGGEPSPVVLCVLLSNSTWQQIKDNPGRSACTNTGGVIWEVGVNLPKFNAEADPNAPSGSGGGPDATCSAKVTDPNASCDVALDCNEGLSGDKCGITRYLKLFINILSGIVGISVVGVLIMSGIQYSMSAGDANAVAAAKKKISNAVLASVVFALMYGFLQWIVPGGVL